ncbi:MAG: glyoxalase/bleomycin resistance protein/dioxygenase [Planctomycetaceae bacterium]|nr:glyoxalase/bleomycin resistance protein/dioxygenase [Planctomycetaceae bacterium]
MSTATVDTYQIETTPDAPTVPVRFHLSLNVSDLPQAVAYFERLLGVPPAKSRADYAKFELDSPPLVFSLEPRSPGLHGSLNHVGFRYANAEALVDVQRRLEEAGIHTEREEGVECCYAKQTKFWVNDLDHRLWEFYVLDGDIDHRGNGQSAEQVTGGDASAVAAAHEPVVYQYLMGQAFTPPEQCDEIRIRGAFSLPTTHEAVLERLQAVRQHLKPGGKIHVHQLTADAFVDDAALDLPGRASVVKHVPMTSELLQALSTAGFQEIALTKFGSNPCFNVNGAELRETMIEARLPQQDPFAQCVDVVYKGPFASLQDDRGVVYKRGERVSISNQSWQALDSAGVAGQFTQFAAATGMPSSCGVSSPV